MSGSGTQGRPPDERVPEADGGSEVFARVAHELMTPLSAAMGFAVVVRDNLDAMDAEAVKRSCNTIVRALKAAENLVQTLAEMRSVDEGDVVLELVEVPVGEFVTEVVHDLEPLTGPHHISVSVLHDGVARIDRMKVRQILTNLLSNAAKFSPPDSPITVDVSGDDRWLEIAVVDACPGIDHEAIERVFDKYERLGAQQKGTGLGLYISRGLARAHGGELSASSDGRNGCRFVLKLPLDPSTAPEPTTG